MTTVEKYREFQKKRNLLPIGYEFPEKVDQIIVGLHHKALAEQKKIVEDSFDERSNFRKRRSKIFESFRGEDYQKDMTRMTIISSLININKKIYGM